MKILNKIYQFIIPRYLILLTVICLLPVIGYYFYLNTSDKNSGISEELFIKSLPKLLEQVNERWRLGDIEGVFGTESFQCSNLTHNNQLFDEQLLKCNPEYLRCFFKQELDGVEFSFKSGPFELEAIPMDNTLVKFSRDGKTSFVLREKRLGKKIFIELENYCHSVYLPKNVYSAGPQSEQAMIWDNYNYDIFVDKFYVTNYEVNKFLGNNISNRETDFLPSTSLDLNTRKTYCKSQGKQLMASHVFDAASFYPTKRVDNFSFKYPYPWTKKRKVHLQESKTLTNSNCKKIFTKECFDILPRKSFATIATSWLGMNMTLGSYMESFSNIFNSRANLKVSSDQLLKDSLWHKTGLRGYWNGVNFLKRDLEFIEQFSQKLVDENIKEFGIAFRCMKVK